MFIIDYPLKFVLESTIPPPDEEHYDHKLLTLWPVFGGLFLWFSFKESFDDHKWLFFIFIPILVLL